MLTIKALHIVSAIFWSAGLLYLPRLFAYHAECGDDNGRRRFCLMESRLYWRIMTPAMAATLCFAALLLQYYRGGWIAWKMLAALSLVAFHIYCGVVARSFARGHVLHSAKFFRLFNEVPALIIAAAVFVAVLKP